MTGTEQQSPGKAADCLPGFKRALFMCGIAALSGCSIFQSEGPANPKTVVTGIPAAWTVPATAEPVGDNWLDEFADPQLKALVEEAWQNNGGLLSAISRRDATAARAELDKGSTLPHLDFQASVNRQRQLNDFLGNSTLIPPEAYISRIRFGLGLSWELDVWNRVLNLDQASAADLASVMLDVEATKFSLAGQTATLWFSLVAAEQRLAVSRQLADSFGETVNFSTKRQADGLITTADLIKAETDQATAEADVLSHLLDRDRAARALEVLLGRYPANALQAETNLPPIPVPITASVPSSLLERRPDIQAAELRVVSNDKRLLASKKNLLPKFTLNASGGTQTKYRDLLFDNDSFTWSLGGGLMQPIFDGGQIRAGIRSQRALLLESISKYREKAYAAFREVEDALDTETSLRAQLVHVKRTVELSQQNDFLATRSYNSGTLDAGTSMGAKRNVLQAQLREIDLNLALLNNRVSLDLALGGSPIVHEDPAATVAGTVPALELSSPTSKPSAPATPAEVPVPASVPVVAAPTSAPTVTTDTVAPTP